MHLGLDAEVVFYPGSYAGWDKALVENFREGRCVGIPLLQRYGRLSNRDWLRKQVLNHIRTC